METTGIFLIFDLICEVGIRSRNKILPKLKVRNIVYLVGSLWLLEYLYFLLVEALTYHVG